MRIAQIVTIIFIVSIAQFGMLPPIVHASSGQTVREFRLLRKIHANKEPSWKLPILMYHYIRTNIKPTDKLGINLSTAPEAFNAQLTKIAEKGFRTITFADIASGTLLTNKVIVLTFDDGYEDAYTSAFPILREHNMKAVFYIITDFVGKAGYMTWSQIQEMQDAGMEIGDHTAHHLDLSKMPPSQYKVEIHDSIQKLESEIKRKAISFAYPSGKYNRNTIKELTSEKNIQYAVTTRGGIATNDDKRLELHRIRINSNTDVIRILNRYNKVRIKPSLTPS